MSILEGFEKNQVILLHGPLATRLKYDYNIPLSSDMSIYPIIYEEKGSQCLEAIYRADIDIAQKYHLPIILSTPTYRAPKNLQTPEFASQNDIHRISLDCYDFVNKIRKSYPQEGADIYIAGSVVPKNNAYDPRLKLNDDEAEKYYTEQTTALSTTKIDFINILTMPGLSEALGCARAASKTHLPYTVGFLITEKAELLDGTPLHEAIHVIDQSVTPKPLCYLIICTHPSTALHGLIKYHHEYDRIKGIKANGSNKSPEELAALQSSLADEPKIFAAELLALKNAYDWKIFGGCCGTNSMHLEAIAEAFSK